MDLFWPFEAGNPLRIGFLSSEMILFCVVISVLGALAWEGRAVAKAQRKFSMLPWGFIIISLQIFVWFLKPIDRLWH